MLKLVDIMEQTVTIRSARPEDFAEDLMSREVNRCEIKRKDLGPREPGVPLYQYVSILDQRKHDTSKGQFKESRMEEIHLTNFSSGEHVPR